ncbi:MAG: Asp-tRNA(Asn)/Glu-tRNA(Gln) amidotransferase subunit GatB [Candidatus Chisholmbacteria bacterium]|nr:Asp-tRNA(Asn)/Glu-tRNA(Gln) amidotransferase subunit GatB [Candidatus Chisholmbacteria bacterium]
MTYSPVIGLEVHVELKTLSKMFCGCPADHFGKKPNTQTCPVCLGLPGALPVPNKKAIDWTLLIGLALDCQVNHHSKFDRKHYFYPDLPKGYQISQYDEPLCVNGHLTLSTSEESKATSEVTHSGSSDGENRVRINRVHLEEDTGKLIHAEVDGEKVSLVDFNRSGVPLVEIVTEADIHGSAAAKEFVKKIHQLIRDLGVSDCDMEKGSMRLEANISLSKDGTLPPYKVEVKNLNSFRFLGRAIDYEIARQKELLTRGQTPPQETRGWSEAKNQTFAQRSKEVAQRSKEEAQDYRYFPEPDIPPLVFSKEQIDAIRAKLPELPQMKAARFAKAYGLKPSVVTILTKTQASAAFFEAAVKEGQKVSLPPTVIANAMVNQRQAFKNPEDLVRHLQTQTQEKVSDKITLRQFIDQVITAHTQAVSDFKAQKPQAIGFLIGQIQRLSHGKADGKLVHQLLLERLESSR